MTMEALELARQIGSAADQAFAEWGIALGLANKGRFGEALRHVRANCSASRPRSNTVNGSPPRIT